MDRLILKKTTQSLIIAIAMMCLTLYSCGGDYPSNDTVGDSPELSDTDDSSGGSDNQENADPEALNFTIFSPADNSVVSGTITISLDVISGSVHHADFYIDNMLKHTDETEPSYEYTWITPVLTTPVGYSIRVVVFDEDGSSIEHSISVTVDNSSDEIPPEISQITPETGSYIDGMVSLSATVTDNIELDTVEFYVDDTPQPIYSSPLPPFEFIWDTTEESNAVHVIRIEAYDTSGNRSVINDIKVLVINRNESGCQESTHPTWDLTGTWTTQTTISDNVTEGTTYIIQYTPCNGNTFSSWGYSAENNEFASTPGIIEPGDTYVLTTDTWERYYIDNPSGWVEVDRIYWIPDNYGNTYSGEVEVTLYTTETGNTVHPLNGYIGNLTLTGARN